MGSIRGGMAGLLTGILLSPIFCILTFLFMFFLAAMSLANVSVLKDFHQFLVGWGNPCVWTVVLCCLVFTLLGFVGHWRFFSYTGPADG